MLIVARPQPAAGGASFGMMAPTPFSARDEWTIAPDGSLAFVHTDPYHVEWMSTNARLSKARPFHTTPSPLMQRSRTNGGDRQESELAR